MQSKSWNVLSPGRRNELVLAVDFASTGRKASSFNELAPKLDPALAIWETVQPPPGAQRTGADYLAWWMADLERGGRPVDAVLGYCAGGVFAAGLAERVERMQGRPPQLIVFDPEPPNAPALLRDFGNVVDHLSSVLSRDEVVAARAAGQRALELQPSFEQLGGELIAIFRRAAADAFARAGLDDELASELIETFASYVAYLVAGRQLDPLAGWARATAIGSAHASAGMKHAGTPIRFDVHHDDILRADPVAQAVRGLLQPSSPR